MDIITERDNRLRYSAMKKQSFEDYVKHRIRGLRFCFVLAIILGISLYLVLVLSVLSYSYITDEKMDNKAFINIAENLCDEQGQKYAKTELLKSGEKVVIYCEKENIIFESIK